MFPSQNKCSCYWPEKVDETITVSTGLTVKLVEENLYNGYKLKKLLLTNVSQFKHAPHKLVEAL